MPSVWDKFKDAPEEAEPTAKASPWDRFQDAPEPEENEKPRFSFPSISSARELDLSGPSLDNTRLVGEASRAVGRGLDFLGEVAKGGLQDVAEAEASLLRVPTYQGQRQTVPAYEPPAGPLFRNTISAFRGEPTPFTRETADVEGAPKILQDIGEGVAHMAPAIAGSAALTAMGVPAPLAAGAVFGFNKEGFDPKQAALMGLPPVVGGLGAKAALNAATKLGVEIGTETGLRALETAGSYAATQAYFDLLAVPEYLSASPKERAELWAKQAGINLALHLPSGFGLATGAVAERQAAKEFERNLNEVAGIKALVRSSPEIPGGTQRGFNFLPEQRNVINRETGTTEFPPIAPQPEVSDASTIETPSSVVGEEPTGPAPQIPSRVTRGLRQPSRARRQAKATPPRQGPALETPIASLIGDEVSYAGKTGTLKQDENGTVIVEPLEGPAIEVEGALKDLSRTAESLGVAYTPKRTFDLTPDGRLDFNGVTYRDPVVNRNDEGVAVSVSAIGPKGKVTMRNPQLAVDVGTALANRAAQERERSLLRPQGESTPASSDVQARRRLLTTPERTPQADVPRGTIEPVRAENAQTPVVAESATTRPFAPAVVEAFKSGDRAKAQQLADQLPEPSSAWNYRTSDATQLAGYGAGDAAFTRELTVRGKPLYQWIEEVRQNEPRSQIPASETVTEQRAASPVDVGNQGRSEEITAIAPKPTLKEISDKIRAEKAAAIAKNLEASGDSGAVELSNAEGTVSLIVSPEPTNPSQWRVTRFDTQGPSGHNVFDSREAAIRAASGDSFSEFVSGPNYYRMGEFTVKRVSKPQVKPSNETPPQQPQSSPTTEVGKLPETPAQAGQEAQGKVQRVNLVNKPTEVANANAKAEQSKPLSPIKATEQKKFLLAEIKKAIEVAGDKADPTNLEAVDDLNRANAVAGIRELYVKYGTPDIDNGKDKQAHLLDTIKRAVEASRPHVTIEVPQDGVFSIINTKEALKAFEEKARRFPTAPAKADIPKLPSSEPRGIPAIKKTATESDKVKALATVASDDPSREVLHYVYSNGKQLVSTNGRVAVIVDSNGQGTTKNPVLIHSKTGKSEPDGFTYDRTVGYKNGKPETETVTVKYPDWKAIVPAKSTLRAKSVDTGKLISILNQAKAIIDKYRDVGGTRQDIRLYVDDEGAIGVESKDPSIGEYRTGVINESSKSISLDANYLLDILAIARRVGHEKVRLSFDDELSPLVVEAPGFKGLQMPMRMSSLTTGGRSEAVTSLSSGRSIIDPSVPEARRLPLWWHEVAVHGGLQSDLVTGRARAEIRTLLQQSSRLLTAEADALSRLAGFEDAAAMREAYGFPEGPDGDTAMLFELLARKAEQLAGKEKPSWWRNLIGQIQLWLAKHFNFHLSQSGVEALIRVGSKRMEGVELETRVIPQEGGTSDLVFALKPASSEKNYEEQTKFDPRMPSNEADFNRTVKVIENFAAIPASVTRGFAALPPKIKAELPQLSGREAAVAAASRDLRGKLPPRATLRDMATSVSPKIEDQAHAMMAGTMNIFELVDSVSDVEAKVKATTKDVDALRKREAAKDQSVSVASEVITDARRRLTAQRVAAEAAGNFALADAINRSIGDLQNRDTAVAQVLKLAATNIPAATLTNPATTPADIGAWLSTYATGKYSAETARLVTNTPDVVSKLRVVAGLEEPANVKAADAALRNQKDALTFMQDVLRNPEFRTNYEQAVDWSQSAGVRKEIGGNPYYENPYNPEDTRTIYPDLDQATWEKNQRAMSDVKGWLERYIADPNADPLKREGFKFALQHLELLQNQSFAPERGKIAPSAVWNPSYALIRGIPKFFDVPEHVLELIGGRLAYSAYYDLVNYSVAGERMVNEHNRLRYATAKATRDAGKAAGFTGTDNQIVSQWQRDIGNDIFSSYQTRGEHRLKAGDMVNGHKITKADMDAVKAQKDYADAVLGALRSMQKGATATTQGTFSPIRTLDVVGKTAFERDAKDISGLTVPQKLKPITRPFVDAWMHPDANREALANDPSFWRAVLSHVESFSNPDYRSFVDSPFYREYLDIGHEIAQTGMRPANLDELATDLFVRLASNIHLRTMSVPEIKAQFLSEIDKVVKASEIERKEHPVLVSDSPEVSAVSAENFMNRPRGERLLPKGFYDYTLGTEEQMSSIRTAAKEIYGHRLLKTTTALRDSLTEKRAQLFQRVQQGLATAETSRRAVQDGTELVHLKEIDRLLPQLSRFISDFEQAGKRAREDERDLYSMVNVGRGWLSNSLLQRFGTLWRNANGGVMNSALMDREMLSQGRNIFYRNWLTQPIYATGKAALQQGETFVRTAAGLLGGTERGKKVAAALRSGRSVLGSWGGEIGQWIDREAARVAEMERLGIMTPQQAGENIAANWDFRQQRGRITQDLETPSAIRKAGRTGVAAIEIAQELGLPMLQIPRSLASPLIDNAVNATSHMQVRDMLDTLHMNAVGALNTRSAFGPISPTHTVLSPQEVYGLTGKSGSDMHRALTALRQEFAKAGVSLDKYLVDYWQAVQRAPGTNPQVLTDAQMNSLRYEMATRMNRGTTKNRPMWNNNATKLMMTFLGYGINQNARLAQFLGSWSRDTRKIDPSSLARAASIIGTLAIVGPILTYLPIKWIENLLYNEEKPVKDLWETRNAGDFALTALRQSYGVLPVVGQVLNYTLGSLTGTGANGQFSLLPVTLATAAANLVNRGFRTGEWDRPTMEFIRQWMPNSRIVLNRVPMREGLTNEGAMRAALAANAPEGVEVKTAPVGAGIRQYSVISGQLDNIVNALSRSGGPDMATVTNERRNAIARLVESGVTEQEAAQTVDRAVQARDPYKSRYGRDLTESERTDLKSHLNSTQLRILDTVEKGRQSYAETFGMPSPDFVRSERTASAGGSAGSGLGVGRSSGGIAQIGRLRTPRSRTGSIRGLRRGTVVGLRPPKSAKLPKFGVSRSRRIGSRRSLRV